MNLTDQELDIIKNLLSAKIFSNADARLPDLVSMNAKELAFIDISHFPKTDPEEIYVTQLALRKIINEINERRTET